jgi:hypothetical protein
MLAAGEMIVRLLPNLMVYVWASARTTVADIDLDVESRQAAGHRYCALLTFRRDYSFEFNCRKDILRL